MSEKTQDTEKVIEDDPIEKALLEIGENTESTNMETLVINRVYDSIKILIQDKNEITVDSILSLTLDTIKITQKICKDYEGKYKKKVVIAIIRKIISQHKNSDDSNKKKLLEYVDISLPHMIDISISIAKGTIDLGKETSLFKNISKSKCC